MESKLNWLRDYLANAELSEIEQLRGELKTARKMFEAIIKTDGKYAVKQAQVCLSQIDVEPEKS